MKEESISMQDDAFWLRLDNAAKIYPSIRTNELTSVFRISVILKKRVKARAFLEAIDELEKRFPYYKVILKPGFFWYYLEHNKRPVTVQADLDIPCRAFDKRSFMFRVLARDNRISVEFSHILTDAAGGFEFLKCLLRAYLIHCGNPFAGDIPALLPSDEPGQEEYEDAYNRFFKKTVSPRMNLRASFHLPFSSKGPSALHLLTMEIPTNQILDKARSCGVSITEYLISVYMFLLQDIYEELPILQQRTTNRIIRIEVPVNLRNFYPTRSMRNFALYVLPEIDLRLGHYTVEEILETVHHLMQLETNKKLIHKILSRNVGGERNLILKRIPLFLKAFLFNTFYALGTSRYSGVVTNLGNVNLPPEISELIDRFVFVPPPPSKKLKVNCGVIGFDNKLVLCFGNITSSYTLEKKFGEFLRKEGFTCDINEY